MITLEIKINYSIEDFAIVTDDEIIFTPVVVSGIFSRAMSHMYFDTSMEERNYPFRDRCSRLVELRENIKLPASATLVYMPEEEGFNHDPAAFKGEYKMAKSGRGLMVSETITLRKRIYEKEDWDAFRSAVAAQQKFSKEPVILKFN